MNSSSLYGGLSAERIYTFPRYPSSTHTLRGRILGGSAPVELATACFTGSGDSWTLLIPAAALDAVATGNYSLQIIAIDSAGLEIPALVESVKIYSKTETDIRSDNQKMLEAIDAVMAKKATRDQASMSYNGRSISRLSWEDLLKARDAVARRVRDEENKQSGKSKIQSVLMRFVEP